MIGSKALPDGIQLYPCLTCGAAIPGKGRTIHEQWHADIAAAAIDVARQVQRLDAQAGTP